MNLFVFLNLRIFPKNIIHMLRLSMLQNELNHQTLCLLHFQVIIHNTIFSLSTCWPIVHM